MSKKKPVGVVLSGCGYLDGAEIQEAVLALYFLQRHGLAVRCFAPDRPQSRVVDHLTGEATGEVRNALVEAARIARGQIEPLERARMTDLAALVLPGGYGAAQTLSTLASRGVEATVDEDLARLVGEAVLARQPMVAICISPAVLAVALHQAGQGAALTIGDESATAQVIEKLGSTHQRCAVDGVVVDEDLRIVSTPAYMLGSGPRDVGAGIEAAIATLAGWLG